ncbi:hypothetical protein ICG_05375 [Bacillus cereus BAG1X1-3]|uniref:DNase/tRNase domain of colicin-like bacteriocin n=1 Tax=Bacillus nitratireducens TaxID=2026193 RepID=A0ABU6PBC7_9BACI|nr:hypothetical protein [Bacillus nitratireducens]EJS47196.1 hypothetical protein ICG_05375 [Bacillus cereus BAG1X1-3]EOO75417.1 hypothetical protein IC7_05276 [Bacillus cereus BAG1O-1]MED4677787.1 hypothetical protein [Bacillus nitratireducens]
MRELEQADRDTTKFMNVTLDAWPIINVPKEIIQLVQGHEMGEKDKYKPSDYAIGVASVLTGGTIKTVKTIGKVVGTVEDIEKKAKNLEKAAKSTGKTIGKINTHNIPNMSKKEILEKLPDGWKYTENNGFVHVRDGNGTIRMRIDPPDKVTKYDHVHLYDENKNPLDVNGSIVDAKSPDAHIPYKK